MKKRKSKKPKIKAELHTRNLHHERYDLQLLSKSYPALLEFVYTNKYDNETVDFFNPKAVVALNRALLKHYYQIDDYPLPDKFLSPPIPGRVDYLHHVADLLISDKRLDLDDLNKRKIKCLDIGTGANCIYPILGSRIYNWSFVASDIDKKALETAQGIIDANAVLEGKIELRVQANAQSIFDGIIRENEMYDLVTCNPPFHASAEEAQEANLRKLRNLKQECITEPTLNFSGTSGELWCVGGEIKFVTDMIRESKDLASNCYYFTSLVSKKTSLPPIYKMLQQVKAKTVKTILMGKGNKISRIVAWRF